MRTHAATAHGLHSRPVAWRMADPRPATGRIDFQKATGWAVLLGANALFWVATVRAAQVFI